MDELEAKAEEWLAWHGFDKHGVAAWLRGQRALDNDASQD